MVALQLPAGEGQIGSDPLQPPWTLTFGSRMPHGFDAFSDDDEGSSMSVFLADIARDYRVVMRDLDGYALVAFSAGTASGAGRSSSEPY